MIKKVNIYSLLQRVKSLLPVTLQFLTLVLVIFLSITAIKQQKEIKSLTYELESITTAVYDVNGKVNDIDDKLDNVESSITSEIEDLESIIEIYAD